MTEIHRKQRGTAERTSNIAVKSISVWCFIWNQPILPPRETLPLTSRRQSPSLLFARKTFPLKRKETRVVAKVAPGCEQWLKVQRDDWRISIAVCDESLMWGIAEPRPIDLRKGLLFLERCLQMSTGLMYISYGVSGNRALYLDKCSYLMERRTFTWQICALDCRRLAK